MYVKNTNGLAAFLDRLKYADSYMYNCTRLYLCRSMVVVTPSRRTDSCSCSAVARPVMTSHSQQGSGSRQHINGTQLCSGRHHASVDQEHLELVAFLPECLLQIKKDKQDSTHHQTQPDTFTGRKDLTKTTPVNKVAAHAWRAVCICQQHLAMHSVVDSCNTNHSWLAACANTTGSTS